MPFQSESQRRFMHAKHPQIAKRWEKHTPSGGLPEKKGASMPQSLRDFGPAMKDNYMGQGQGQGQKRAPGRMAGQGPKHQALKQQILKKRKGRGS